MQESYLSSSHYDLASPDGRVTQLQTLSDGSVDALVLIEKIAPTFSGYRIGKEDLFFNLKSTLAQLGINGIGKEYTLDPKHHRAEVKVHLFGIGEIARLMLSHLSVGAYVGKLFGADPKRRVRSPDYLLRMFGRHDREGRPLLSLGEHHGQHHLHMEAEDGRLIAYLALQRGKVEYAPEMKGFLPFLGKALLHREISLRPLLEVQQIWKEGGKRSVERDEILLVRTLPLHIRTVFGHVASDFLPAGVQHTTASILDPTTEASGNIYELFGSSDKEIDAIPLEFYTLEPHREHVFFTDRDQLQSALDKPEAIFKAFDTAPKPDSFRTAVFVVKGEQLFNLKPSDWIAREPEKGVFPGLIHPGRQAFMVKNYIKQQPSYPFLRAIESGLITSDGILLSRHFPSPLMKTLLISEVITRNLKALYFEKASFSSGDFFSHEDRSMLHDLAKFAIPVFWADRTSGQILQYVPKPDKDCGMFVPLARVSAFMHATFFGVYGSNLLPEVNFEKELTTFFEGLKAMKEESLHPLLNKETPLALVTGGGPGVMELGNKVAKALGVLSCANIVDFRPKSGGVINEQRQNPYVEAKMTYRIDRLVERQAEFNLDFPIFLIGGMGTDFEYALEEVRRKVGANRTTPVILFGPKEYWHEKITARFQSNLASGTIAGSEWVSNCFFSVETASAALKVYRDFFTGKLEIGKGAPAYKEGFRVVR